MPLDTLKQLLYDPEDAHLLEPYIWRMSRGYASRIVNIGGKRVRVYAHRIIAGAGVGDIVDHINGNPSDNRRANLRIVSHMINMQNRRMHRNNKSGYRGVYYDAWSRKWVAQVRANGKRINLGRFSSAAEAGRVAEEYRLMHMPAYNISLLKQSA